MQVGRRTKDLCATHQRWRLDIPSLWVNCSGLTHLNNHHHPFCRSSTKTRKLFLFVRQLVVFELYVGRATQPCPIQLHLVLRFRRKALTVSSLFSLLPTVLIFYWGSVEISLFLFIIKKRLGPLFVKSNLLRDLSHTFIWISTKCYQKNSNTEIKVLKTPKRSPEITTLSLNDFFCLQQSLCKIDFSFGLFISKSQKINVP